MGDDFKYNAFISYKSEDKAWADRLRERLEAKGLSIYQDVQLRGGEKWLPQLQDALEASKHLVLLWSASAGERTGWVDTELNHFLYRCHLQETPARPRRIIPVLLDNSDLPTHWGELHARTELRQGGARLDYVDSPAAGVWDKLIVNLMQDLTHLPSHRPVLSVILASTRNYFESTDLTKSQGMGKSLDSVLDQLRLKCASATPPAVYAEFLDRYGAQREEWRPFGANGPTVAELLSAAEVEVNQSLARAGLTEISLVPVDNTFWSGDVAKVDSITRSLASKHSLVVIDPLSLYDPYIQARAARLRDCLKSSGSAVVMLGPFGMGAGSLALMEHVQAMAQDVYRHFFDPELPFPSYSPSAANVSDPSQIKRYLLLALGRVDPQRPGASSVPFFGHES